MTSAGRSTLASVGTETAAERDWLAALTSGGRERDLAIADLHALMVKASRHQVQRMRGLLPAADGRLLDELAQSCADDAVTALLGKLHTFEGRSRFTTWAYKFAILQAATEVRRQAWSTREVALDDVEAWRDTAPGPEDEALGSDLAGEVARAMNEDLTPYQRRIAVALLVDQVPIDVLAERLGTTRGALYKSLHMARSRLRAHLVASGHLPAGTDPRSTR